jgi:hypothetical protein
LAGCCGVFGLGGGGRGRGEGMTGGGVGCRGGEAGASWNSSSSDGTGEAGGVIGGVPWGEMKVDSLRSGPIGKS